MVRERVWIKVAAWSLLTALLAACGSGRPKAQQQATAPARPAGSSMIVVDGDPIGDQALVDAAKKEGSVTIYTAGVTLNEQKIAAAFGKRFGIKVNIVREVGGRLHERLMTEEKASKHIADVLHQSDVSLANSMIQDGLVVAHKVPVHDKYGPGLRDENGYFYVTLLPLMAIAYNSELVKESEAPKTWQDILDPKWKGKIGMTHAGIGGTGWSLAYFWRKEFGEDYWKKIAAQQVTIYQGGANVAAALTKGEISIAVNADANNSVEELKGAPIVTTYPKEGVPGATYSFMLLKNAPHPNAARLYANWYTSAEAQKINHSLGSFSGRRDLPSPPMRPKAADINLYVPKDMQEFIRVRDPWVNEWNTVFGYR